MRLGLRLAALRGAAAEAEGAVQQRKGLLLLSCGGLAEVSDTQRLCYTRNVHPTGPEEASCLSKEMEAALLDANKVLHTHAYTHTHRHSHTPFVLQTPRRRPASLRKWRRRCWE